MEAFAPQTPTRRSLAPSSNLGVELTRTANDAGVEEVKVKGDVVSSKDGNSNSEPEKSAYDFALLFDCDGVILETEELHRLAYNAAFKEFGVTRICGDISEPVEWSVGYYDILQNSIGGGKPKMRHYFSQLLRFESNENGDPTTIEATIRKKKRRKKKMKNAAGSTTVTLTAADVSTGLESLIDSLQKRKTDLYKKTVADTAVPRPGLLSLMDEALADDSIAVGVCSASTKAAAQKVLECTLGKDRVKQLDVCILGDDVSEKKPSPMIYNAARKKLNIDLPTKCVVVEDSAVGLRAAKAAGMRCLITYTASTTNEDFYGMGADAKVPDLVNGGKPITLDSIFQPLKMAFASNDGKDQSPELLVGLKDEVPEDDEVYDDEDNLVLTEGSSEESTWSTTEPSVEDENSDAFSDAAEAVKEEEPSPPEASQEAQTTATPTLPKRRILKPKMKRDDMGNFVM